MMIAPLTHAYTYECDHVLYRRYCAYLVHDVVVPLLPFMARHHFLKMVASESVARISHLINGYSTHRAPMVLCQVASCL